MDLKALWSGFDWFILVVYFIVLIVIGVMFSRRASSGMKSFFAASRKLTVPVLVGTAAASWYESWTIVGLAELGGIMGISIIFIYVVPTALLRIPLATIIGPFVRDKIPDWVITLPDLVEYLYDKKTKLISAVTVAAAVLYSSALLFAVGQVMHLITGIPLFASMFITGVVVAIYTSLAGMWGIAVTDVIQFAIMTVGAAFLAFPLVSKAEGIPHLFAEMAAKDPLLVQPLGGSSALTVLAWVIAAATLYVSPQSYQRFGAAKSGAEVKVAYNLMMFIGISFSAVMVLSGMVASIEYPDLAPAVGFWTLVFDVMPIGMRGLFVAALIAAVMSTIDADFLICSTVLSKDFYKTFVNPKLTDQQVVRATKWIIPLLSLIMVLGTYFWQGGIGKAWYYVGGFQTAVFIIPLLAGLFYPKRTPAGGFIAVFVAAVFYPIWEFALKAPGGIPANVSTWVVSAVVYFAVCAMTYKAEAKPSIKV